MDKSPRFSHRWSDLKGILEIGRLKSIWKNHIRQANRTQLVADLIDYFDVHLSLDEEIDAIRMRFENGTYSPKPPPSEYAWKSQRASVASSQSQTPSIP